MNEKRLFGLNKMHLRGFLSFNEKSHSISISVWPITKIFVIEYLARYREDWLFFLIINLSKMGLKRCV